MQQVSHGRFIGRQTEAASGSEMEEREMGEGGGVFYPGFDACTKGYAAKGPWHMCKETDEGVMLSPRDHCFVDGFRSWL